ncbi:hypothetical protein AO392_17335 [Pseudomonas putida]|nr:hypothetical protein AO392_17335 [Pseudomonas putida]
MLARNELHPAIDALTQALDLAPFSAALAIMLARAHTFVGQTDKGLKIIEQAVADHPVSTMVYIYFLTYQAFIRPTEDIAAKLLKLTDNDLTWSFAPSSVVYALARCGETKKARTLLEANLHHNPCMRATFTSGMLLLGLKNQALDCLSEAAALGCGFLPISLRAPENQGLADHEAYRELQSIVFSRV